MYPVSTPRYQISIFTFDMNQPWRRFHGASIYRIIKCYVGAQRTCAVQKNPNNAFFPLGKILGGPRPPP